MRAQREEPASSGSTPALDQRRHRTCSYTIPWRVARLAVGVCLCLGCWLEGGKDLMGADALTAIRTFAGMGAPSWCLVVVPPDLSPPAMNYGLTYLPPPLYICVVGAGKLFKVHFRNVSNPMPTPWQESLLDEGYMDSECTHDRNRMCRSTHSFFHTFAGWNVTNL